MSRELIDLWLAAETAVPGRRTADALRDLSAGGGVTIGHNRLSEWRLGRRPLPMWARRYIAQRAGDRIIAALGLAMDDEEWDRLVEVVLG